MLFELDDLYPQSPVSTSDGPCFEKEDTIEEETKIEFNQNQENIQEEEEEEGIYL